MFVLTLLEARLCIMTNHSRHTRVTQTICKSQKKEAHKRRTSQIWPIRTLTSVVMKTEVCFLKGALLDRRVLHSTKNKTNRGVWSLQAKANKETVPWTERV